VKAFINQRFLRQTEFDSASPAGSAVTAHEIGKEGSYELAVAHHDRLLVRLPFGVEPPPDDKRSAAKQSCGAEDAPRRSLSVDLAKVTRAGAPPDLASLSGAGWVSFTSSQPMRGHHIVLRRMEEGGEAQDEFDSRRLDDRSLFGLTLVRPGRYSLVNAIDGAKAEIVVAYPQVGKTAYRPPEPLQIVVTADGFGERSFPLMPAQGIVFRFRTETRIQIELVEPDDGPGRGRSEAA
jgi:hypothetical protein